MLILMPAYIAVAFYSCPTSGDKTPAKHHNVLLRILVSNPIEQDPSNRTLLTMGTTEDFKALATKYPRKTTATSLFDKAVEERLKKIKRRSENHLKGIDWASAEMGKVVYGSGGEAALRELTSANPASLLFDEHIFLRVDITGVLKDDDEKSRLIEGDPLSNRFLALVKRFKSVRQRSPTPPPKGRRKMAKDADAPPLPALFV